MQRRRQKILARSILLAFTGLGIAWLLGLNHAKRISTDVEDLLPAKERDPEVALVRSLATDLQARVVLIALRDPGSPATPPTAAAALFARELGRSPQFATVLVLGGAAADTATAKSIFDRRDTLLLPSWLGQKHREFERTGRPEGDFSPWLADRSAADLEAFLGRPEALSMQSLVQRDPLVRPPRRVERRQAVALSGSAAGGQALVWARIIPSPFTQQGQAPVFEAIERATARMRADYPRVELRWTGVNRFAAASRIRIEHEIRVLNGLSLAAVFIVGCLFVRRPWKMLHLVPVVLLSLLGAWAASTMAFDRIHIIVFVIGAVLSGVAIDYGFYIYMHPALRPGESYLGKLRRILKPLLASCLTTVMGFSMLLFSDLPFIRQVGFFVGAGLLCAMGAAMLYFAQLDLPYLESRFWGRVAGRAPIAPRAQEKSRRRWLLLAALGAAAIAVLGPWRLHWRDDVRELQIPAPELDANEAAVSAVFGEKEEQAVFLTYGTSVANARDHLDAFLASDAGANGASLGLLFPTEADWRDLRARLGSLDGFEDDFRRSLDRRGFDPESFGAFFADWESLRKHPPRGAYSALYDEMADALGGPLSLLYSARGPLCWFLTLQPGVSERPLPERLFTVGVNQLQTLNHLFTRYRWSALRLSLVGLGLVVASVFAIYPLRRGLRIALIPSGSCFFVFGVFGCCGMTLNLFNLLGAFLGVCLAHNYAIFSSETARNGEAPPAPVRLSAFCAATSFGVLALSRIPVVHALGLTVACIVVTALGVVELEPLARERRSIP